MLYDILLNRYSIQRSNYIVHTVLLNLQDLNDRFDVGLLIVEGDRPWFEVVTRRMYSVGVYDEGDKVRIVENDNYISNRAYNLLATRYKVYGLLDLRSPYGIASTLYMTPITGTLRLRLPTGTLRYNLNS